MPAAAAAAAKAAAEDGSSQCQQSCSKRVLHEPPPQPMMLQTDEHTSDAALLGRVIAIFLLNICFIGASDSGGDQCSMLPFNTITCCVAAKACTAKLTAAFSLAFAQGTDAAVRC
jgi:hypothetical protein